MLHTHEIDDIADRFRNWLRETDEELNDPQVVALAQRLSDHAINDSDSEDDSVGLLQLAESLTAMRHDYKLQAKGLRQLHDDVQAAMASMDQATGQLESARSHVQREVDKATTDFAKPLLDALLDINEALEHALVPIPPSTEPAFQTADNHELLSDIDSLFHELPRWKRFFVHSTFERVRARVSAVNQPAADDTSSQSDRPAGNRMDPAGTLEGLVLLRTRVRRALDESGVTPMNCVGKRVDPRTMRVVDVVDDAQQSPEMVIEEVRAGYVRHDKIIRIAEVRATRSLDSHRSNSDPRHV